MMKVQFLNQEEGMILVYLSLIRKVRERDNVDALTVARELRISETSARTSLESLVQKGQVSISSTEPRWDHTIPPESISFGINDRGEKTVKEERYGELRKRVSMRVSP